MELMRWVIGDIHGMLRPLNALLDEVQKRDAAARFVFVGDYVNRGPESPGVVDRLLTLDNATFLRGNHDDIFDLILSGASYIGREHPFDPVSGFLSFMNHGLMDTLCAYGADYAELEYLVAHPTPERLKKTVEIVPEKHRQFFRALRAVAEYDTYFVAHAYWNVDEPDSSPDLAARLVTQSRLRWEMLWGRYTLAQVQSKKRWKRTGYFGHTPVANYRKDEKVLPVYGPQIVLLDTGVALGAQGRLSAVCADSGELVQVDRMGAIVDVNDDLQRGKIQN
jgi:hypothetical protein